MKELSGHLRACRSPRNGALSSCVCNYVGLCPANVEEKKNMKKIPYRELVGGLQFVAQCSRPDISHMISVVRSFCSNPGPAHWIWSTKSTREPKRRVSPATATQIGVTIPIHDGLWAGTRSWRVMRFELELEKAIYRCTIDNRRGVHGSVYSDTRKWRGWLSVVEEHENRMTFATRKTRDRPRHPSE